MGDLRAGGNILFNLKYIQQRVTLGYIWLRIPTKGSFFQQMNKPSGSMKARNALNSRTSNSSLRRTLLEEFNQNTAGSKLAADDALNVPLVVSS